MWYPISMVPHPGTAAVVTRQGFSLVELLVVISIIALLASLLMPALALVRTAAQGTRCAANLKPLQLGNLAYSIDNEGIFLPLWQVEADSSVTYLWPNTTFMTDYCDNGRAANRLCPLARPQIGTPSLINNFSRSYGFNPGHTWGPFPYVGPALTVAGYHSAWGRTSEIIAMGDALDWLIRFEDGAATKYWVGSRPSPEGVYNKALAYRHRGRATVVMFDGHSETGDQNQMDVRSRWADN